MKPQNTLRMVAALSILVAAVLIALSTIAFQNANPVTAIVTSGLASASASTSGSDSSSIFTLAAARLPPFYVANEGLSSAITGNTNNTTNATDMSDLLTYTNSTYGIALQLPINWDVYDAFNNTNTSVLTIANVIPPLSADPMQETSVYVTIDKTFQNSSSSIHLGGYVYYIINNLRDVNGRNFTLLSSADSTLANHNGYTLVYTLRDSNGTPVKYMEVGTLIDKIGYLIIYSTPPSKFDALLPQVQKIIASFQILSPGKGLKVSQ